MFVLTDGEVNNTDECISAVRDNAHTTRVFTFGIGDAASVRLCEGMAEAGEGRAEFIRTGTNMQEKVWNGYIHYTFGIGDAASCLCAK